MYDETDQQGRSRYTVAQIADTFSVSHKTIYRYLTTT
ncbi:helix-turn-helix domain-containing protein [Nocardia sp. CWNU-33]